MTNQITVDEKISQITHDKMRDIHKGYVNISNSSEIENMLELALKELKTFIFKLGQTNMRENIVGTGNECRVTKEQNQNVVGGGLESVITEKAIVKHSFQGHNLIRSMQSKQASKSNESLVSHETNRLYVKTDKYPDGKLITGTEVDRWIDAEREKAVQNEKERIIKLLG